MPLQFSSLFDPSTIAHETSEVNQYKKWLELYSEKYRNYLLEKKKKIPWTMETQSDCKFLVFKVHLIRISNFILAFLKVLKRRKFFMKPIKQSIRIKNHYHTSKMPRILKPLQKKLNISVSKQQCRTKTQIILSN